MRLRPGTSVVVVDGCEPRQVSLNAGDIVRLIDYAGEVYEIEVEDRSVKAQAKKAEETLQMTLVKGQRKARR